MSKELIGRKIGMTQYIQEDGTVIPVSVCELGPCVVVQKKSEERDGYSALKVGFVDGKEKHLSKSVVTDLKNKGLPIKRVFREISNFDESFEVGSVIDCSIFEDNDFVHVTGKSKGKGFAGAIKRHRFGGGRATHGSHFHRAPGAVGACADPAKIWKGQKMPGRMGNDNVTVKNLKIVKVLKDKNIVLISGAVPGGKHTLIKVTAK